MYTQQNLREKCTEEFIRWCCTYVQDYSIESFLDYYGNDWLYQFINEWEKFPLFLYRTVEGFNKQSNGYLNFIKIDINYISYWATPNKHHLYLYNEYSPEDLTQHECALFHCLLDIYEKG